MQKELTIKMQSNIMSIIKNKKILGEIIMKKLFTILMALVMSVACLSMAACQQQSADKVKLININLTEEQYAFAMNGSNSELQESFNAYLTEIKANGTFDTIMAKYFENKGEKIGYSYEGDGSGDGSTLINTEGKLVVGTNCPWSPFEYIDGGKVYGVDMEIAAGYAQKHGLELVIANIDFDAIFTSLDAGYIDVGMAGITVSEDRAAYKFTQTYYNASLQIIVKADNTAFDACETVEDVEAVLSGLEGKDFGFQNGTTSGDYIAEYSNLHGVGYETASLATLDVVNGNIYAVICDNAPASAIVKSYNN